MPRLELIFLHSASADGYKSSAVLGDAMEFHTLEAAMALGRRAGRVDAEQLGDLPIVGRLGGFHIEWLRQEEPPCDMSCWIRKVAVPDYCIGCFSNNTTRVIDQ